MEKNTQELDSQELTKRAQKVIDYFGGPYQLAKKLGITDWAIRKWYHSKIPPQRAKQIEKITEGKFTKEYMRSDYFEKSLPIH